MYEYAWLVEHIRENHESMELEKAVDKALDDMPKDFGIRAMLLGNREEVRMDVLTEWDVNSLNRWLHDQGRDADVWRGADDKAYQGKLFEEMYSSQASNVKPQQISLKVKLSN